jgi:hypothetical protein
MGKGGQKKPRGGRERITETEDRRERDLFGVLHSFAGGGGGGAGGSREFFSVGRLKGGLLLAAHCPAAANVSCFWSIIVLKPPSSLKSRVTVRGQFSGVPIPSFSVTLDHLKHISDSVPDPLPPLPSKYLAEIATCPTHHFHPLSFSLWYICSSYTLRRRVLRRAGQGGLPLTFRAFEV